MSYPDWGHHALLIDSVSELMGRHTALRGHLLEIATDLRSLHNPPLTVHPITGRKATFCLIGSPQYHRPQPLRWVWHHNIPQVCGGLSDEANLKNLCDNCHMIQHVLMWRMVFDSQGLRRDHFNRQHWDLALAGYNGAKALGTLDKMPKEA